MEKCEITRIKIIPNFKGQNLFTVYNLLLAIELLYLCFDFYVMFYPV